MRQVAAFAARFSGLRRVGTALACASLVCAAPAFDLRQGERGALAASPSFRVPSVDRLAIVFDRIGYRLERVRRHGEVPRLFLADLPRDMPGVRAPATRKDLFIKAVLPLILHVNERIEHDRERIQGLRAAMRSSAAVGPTDVAWLDSIRDRYGVDGGGFDDGGFDALLRRVDIVPPSLALAQAAAESGWGTSRFAHKGNALFGQRIFRGGNGMVPQRRERGLRHRVRAFDRLIDGVATYAHNLNTHRAYAAFRRAREAMRDRGGALDGHRLAGTLVRYAEDRQTYVKTIRSIIRVNGLETFDRAWLGRRVSLSAKASGA